MNGTIIWVDSNEHSHHPEHMKKFHQMGAMCQVKSLDYDFKIATPDGFMLKVERKTPNDFLESIKDRRLFNQVSRLVEGGGFPYVIIEGVFFPDPDGFVWFDGQTRKFQWSSLQGALISVQELGVSIVYDQDFHGAVGRLVSRSRSMVKIPPRREPYVFSEQETIMMSLPGVGSKKAIEYLELSNHNVAVALTMLTAPHDGKKNYVPGWGKKSRDNLVNVLGGSVEIITRKEE